MEIAGFDDLLQAARQQLEPQRLLFVFAKAMLPKDADAAERQRYEAGQGGGLLPVLSVDKSPEELGRFADLVEESKQVSNDWHIAFVASLGGQMNAPPDKAAVERGIRMMISTIQNGGDIDRFLAFDRNGQPLMLTRS